MARWLEALAALVDGATVLGCSLEGLRLRLRDDVSTTEGRREDSLARAESMVRKISDAADGNQYWVCDSRYTDRIPRTGGVSPRERRLKEVRQRWEAIFSCFPNMCYPEVLDLRLGQVLSGCAGWVWGGASQRLMKSTDSNYGRDGEESVPAGEKHGEREREREGA